MAEKEENYKSLLLEEKRFDSVNVNKTNDNIKKENQNAQDGVIKSKQAYKQAWLDQKKDLTDKNQVDKIIAGGVQ